MMSLQGKLAEVIEQHQIIEDGGCACRKWVGTVPHSDHVAAWLVAAIRDPEARRQSRRAAWLRELVATFNTPPDLRK